MRVSYLEIVSPNVDEVCATYEKLYGASFSAPVAVLGNARTAVLADGGKIGVRAPMCDMEAPLMRSYLLVDDIERSVKQVVESGGEIAHPPFELPGEGTFAIFIQGGIQHGIWQH